MESNANDPRIIGDDAASSQDDPARMAPSESAPTGTIRLAARESADVMTAPAPELRALTLGTITAAEDVRRERVDIPEWGGFGYCYGLTAEEMAAVQKGAIKLDEDGKADMDFVRYQFDLVMVGFRDENGRRFFLKDAGREALSKKSSNVVNRLFKTIQRLSGDTTEAKDALAGNSDTTYSV